MLYLVFNYPWSIVAVIGHILLLALFLVFIYRQSIVVGIFVSY